MSEHNLSTKDFGYCEDCKTFYDLWKFDYNAEEAGHNTCKTRAVTEEELPGLIESCEEPHPVCPECDAFLDETNEPGVGIIYYCGFCQLEFIAESAKWSNCFGECPGPKDDICNGCAFMTKISGSLTCSKDGPCDRI
jgi:hypothetical protein